MAEGLKNNKKAALLFAMGIDYLQGYNFAKQMRNEELIIWQHAALKGTSSL